MRLGRKLTVAAVATVLGLPAVASPAGAATRE
jgi:hypothetical protein